MEIGNLLNDNLSKKMGISMLGMYLVSQSTEAITGYTIAGLAALGIVVQGFIDWQQTRDVKGDK